MRPKGIARLGMLLAGSSAVATPSSFEEAETQCERGDSVACSSYGLSLIKGWRDGTRVPQDVTRGVGRLGLTVRLLRTSLRTWRKTSSDS